MIVFIAGATGAVGRPLVQQLASAGHEVIGTTRSAEKLGHLRSAYGRRRRRPRQRCSTTRDHHTVAACHHRPAHRPGTTAVRARRRATRFPAFLWCFVDISDTPWASPPGLGLAGGALGGARGAASQRIRTWWAHR